FIRSGLGRNAISAEGYVLHPSVLRMADWFRNEFSTRFSPSSPVPHTPVENIKWCFCCTAGIVRSSLTLTLKYPCWFQTFRDDTQGSLADLYVRITPASEPAFQPPSWHITRISVEPSASTSATI